MRRARGERPAASHAVSACGRSRRAAFPMPFRLALDSAGLLRNLIEQIANKTGGPCAGALPWQSRILPGLDAGSPRSRAISRASISAEKSAIPGGCLKRPRRSGQGGAVICPSESPPSTRCSAGGSAGTLSMKSGRAPPISARLPALPLPFFPSSPKSGRFSGFWRPLPVAKAGFPMRRASPSSGSIRPA